METSTTLPIYATSEKEYYEKWDRRITSNMEQYDSVMEEAETNNIDQNIINNARQRRYKLEKSSVVGWRYNAIIGFLLIGIDEPFDDIIFEVVMEEGPHRYDARTKKEKRYWNMLGGAF